ncbi:non-homologous end-joining DNA ligase [Pedosphaera parvula]|uniref:DNA ligase (ATP) n=1 Tax=Pedosphaera parvula (strain Ellin514) TaxID=320771 RepID=B9XDC4_PEDPL|nr:non-homologous end-joining DNA ligase [Pedosphaera parvula]EEF62070.1 DNA polymerase LigD, ligase domain protein [Pedosphaera parvula Ellin514]
MSLTEYSRKRDFKRTAEPKGRLDRSSKRHRFVIQKHAASHLHYDFRLEMGGTLKSWAVPKGVPFARGEKRLAMEVEDHPVSYIDFEGTIPKGEYGGGTVMVWDKGTFEPLSKEPLKELAGGKLHFILHGSKLNGEWYLVRLRGGRQWLLIKGGSDMKPVSKKMDDTSARSGKSMAELAGSGQAWKSNRATSITKVEKVQVRKLKKASPTTKVSAVRERKSSVKFIEPMKARLVEAPPPGEWIYEVKFDGFRALAFKHGSKVTLLSRNKKDLGEKFPEVVDSIAQIDAEEAIIDGEIVALDKKGRSSFQLLQRYDMGQARPAIFFYAFDLLRLNGKDLRKETVVERKAELERLLTGDLGIVRYSASLEGEVGKLLKQAQKLGLEGLIGKLKNSVYEAGQRSGSWIKLKLHHEQEMVIGGYTDPEGSRKYFGALLVGYYDKKELRFAGKVGTGFNHALLESLYATFNKMGQANCPFVNLPEKRRGRSGQGLTASEMKRCHWLKPKLVCQLKFSEWTEDEKLRQPVFLGLRKDKDAREVVREKPE